MWVWVFGIVGLLGVWGIPALLSLFGIAVTLDLRLALSAAVIAIVVLSRVYARWRAGAQARALEREILKQSDEQLKNARPDRRAEIADLRKEIERGIQALKASKVGGKTGRSALYALPWYTIIGPSGAGKTTLLQKSGLTFALTDGVGGAIKGSGGTRNCDWWFTNDAILLDTAGRYATEEQERSDWIAFLDMLRRFRSARPINGVILAVSVSDLMATSEDGIAELAKNLRARIDELTSRLEIVVPVYVMFTKTDLIDGFVELWGDLRKSERDQILGATFPLEAIPMADPKKAFENEFSRLIDVVHAHVVRHVAIENAPEARAKIVQFPLELHALRRSLGYFVGLLFTRNRFQATPLFRGFYFTSSTQEGTPVGRVVSGMVRAFGLAEALPKLATPVRETKSYFVADLFQRVIFPDQSIATRTDRQARRRALLRVALATSCVFAGFAMVAPASVTFSRNRSLIASALATTERADKVDWSTNSDIASKAKELDSLKQLVAGLQSWKGKGAPVSMGWGMYSGNTLLPGARDAYAGILHRALALPVRPHLESELRSFTPAASSTATYGRQYTDLKLYLMLGDPKHLDVDWAAPLLTTEWAKALHSRSANADERALAPHARYYLELMKAGEVGGWDLDASLVEAARTVLTKSPQVERAYSVLVRQANADVAPIQQEDILYGTAARYFTSAKSVKIDGAYTKAGFPIVMKTLQETEKLMAAEAWVLAQPLSANPDDGAKLMAQLQDLYFRRYQESWHAFLSDVSVRQPSSYDDALELLGVLSEPEWPYRRLISQLADNVRLDVDQSALQKLAAGTAQGATSALAGRVGVTVKTTDKQATRFVSPMEEAFAPLLDFGASPVGSDPDKPPPGISQYIASLGKVVSALSDAKETQYTQPDAVIDQANAAVRGTQVLLDTQSAYTRPLLEPLLVRPLALPGAAGPTPGKP
jgi:type VI secretion system protein ImpL